MSEANNDKDQTRAFFVPNVGTRIAHYELVERLGSGGMGDVFLAVDSKLNRRVAVKFLSQQLSSDEDAKSRFLREAQAAASLNHPNIVTVYEVSEHEGRPFIVMEHVSGRLLKEILKDELPLTTIIDIASQLCDGLQKAHQQGIVHRDVKPANIVVGDDGRPRLLDFGLATVAGTSQITRAGSTLGTISYMSPEQAQGLPVDHRSDIFALGIVLYEMISKKQPFARDTDAATLGAIIYDSPEPVSKYRPDISEGLQSILDRALDKDLETRYQSASGLMADLKRERKVLDGVTSSPSRPAVRAGKPEKSKRLPLLISGVGLLLIVAILVLRPWNLTFVTDQQAQASEQWLSIMYFDNLTDPGDEQRLGEIVTNLLITDLSEAKSIKVVSSQRLYDILKSFGREGQRRIDHDMASQIAEKANARWMLTGSILQVDPAIIMTAQLIDVATGGVLASQRIDGDGGEKIFSVTGKLARKLRLDPAFPREVSSGPKVDLASVSTSSPDAYRYFLEGLELMKRFDNTEARRSFRRAVDIDSTFAIAWMRLASVSDGDAWKTAKEKALRFIDHANPMEQLMIKAYGFQADGNNAKSRDLYADAASRYPDNTEILHLLSIAYSNTGEYQECVEALNRILSFDPTNKNAWNQLAYTYMRLGNNDSALIAVNHYVELAPTEPNPYDSKGDILANAGMLDSASIYYQRALKIKPDFTMQTTVKLALLNTMLGRFEEAEQLLRQGMNSGEQFERRTARRQWVYFQLYQGKFHKALEELESVITAEMLEGGMLIAAELYITKSRILYYLGDLETAWTELQKFSNYIDTVQPAIPYGSRAPISRTWLGAETGHFDECDKILKNLTSEMRDDSSAATIYHRARGHLLMVQKKYLESIEEFQTVVKSHPLFSSQFELGRIYVRAGRFREAADVLEPIRKKYSDQDRSDSYVANVLYYYYLGLAYEGLGEREKAIADFTTFTEIWKNADAPIKELTDARQRLAALKSRA